MGECDHNQNGNRRTKNNRKKSISNYYYYVGSTQQASDYKTTTEFIINHVMKTYDYAADITNALCKEKDYDFTSHKTDLQVSEETDVNIKEKENKEVKLEYFVEYNQFIKHKRAYDSNKVKVYAQLW